MYGITGVPSLVLFHNGRPIAKYNGSDYSLYEFTKFVIRHTGIITCIFLMDIIENILSLSVN